MNTEEKIEIIEKLVECRQAIGLSNDSFHKVFGVSFVNEEGPLFEMEHLLFDTNISFAAQLTGLSKESIEWFIWDNSCGISALGAVHEGAEIKIRNATDFVEFEELTAE